MKETKTYWKGIEQLENTPEFKERISKEFPGYLPINEGENGEPSRRDFLKMMGFGVAAASLAACEAPVRKAIPYVNKPVDVDPGIPNYYASTYAMGNDVSSIVVKTREGRPIKIEGNNLSKISGGTTTQIEASVLSLYDQERLQNPKVDGEDTDWNTIDNKIKLELGSNPGKISILSYSNCSPSTLRAIKTLNAKYGNVEHIQYDAVSFSGILDAYESATGSRMLPVHDFSAAKTIVSFGADFLGSWPNQVLNNKQFAATRKLGPDKKDMSRLYVFESNLSLTGSNADYRKPIKPSQQGSYIANLYNLIAQKAGANTVRVGNTKDTTSLLEKAANDLWKSKGKSLVISGSNDVNEQLMVIAINDLLGSYGATIDLSKAIHTRKGSDKAFTQLISDIKAGQVGTVIFYNCNPAYDHVNGPSLISSLGKVKTTISTSDRMDETSASVKYITPDSHFLESWNDFEAVTGHLSLAQPTMNNIFNTRQAQESFLVWSDNTTSYYDFIREGWADQAAGDFEMFWKKSLHDGVLEVEAETSEVTISIDPTVAAGNIRESNTGGMEVALYTNYSIGDGVQANNPWLQEMPDPITKACWDNYFTVSLAEAMEKGWIVEGGDMDYKVAVLTVNGKSVIAPVIPQPGQAYGTVGLALGYGRTKAGNVGNGIGINAYDLVSSSADGLSYNLSGASLDLTGEIKKVAQTQTSQTYSGRETVIQETVLGAYQKNPQAGRYMPKISAATGEKLKPYAVSLWKGHEYPNHHWGMMVDLNSCTGCGTCTIACQTENNIPVVGKEEVLNRREMHWIRIDRYYSSRSENELKEFGGSDLMEVKQKELAEVENPEVTFQPMMCQQCNNAPCETVCPVAATTHSTEGLNQMTYNRCIGTRYCANNCPYKVRRFNWFKYHDNKKFNKNMTMNNDLGKMVLNPDVTVRARGVMEKCTFCVQRIQSGKLEAKKERRRPVDGEIQTACAKSCPSDALIFGDMKDPESNISRTLDLQYNEKSVESKEPRAYHVLEELRVMPNVWYLTKVRNKDENEKIDA
ncbi:MAG: TAT-variant-translocated molybdopterin oxidoreductase [Ekhidna sp.]|nr:TAT-variant-translocated molybdopterin oxidoreductase [Ekhidna sp.]